MSGAPFPFQRAVLPAPRRRARALLAGCCLALAWVARGSAAPVPLLDEPELNAWVTHMARQLPHGFARVRRAAEARLAEARAGRQRDAEICARIFIGAALSRQNDVPGALRETEEANRLAQQAAAPADVRGLALYWLAVMHHVAGNLATAMEFAQRALVLAEQRGSALARATAMSLLGSCQHKFGETARAQEWLRRGLAAAEESGDAPAILTALVWLAGTEASTGDFAAAREHYARGLAIARETGRTRDDIDDLLELRAMAEFEAGERHGALATLQSILRRRRVLKGRMKLTGTLCNCARVLVALGRPDEALGPAEEAARHVENIAAHRLRSQVFETLAQVQEARGDFAAALAALRRFHAESEATAGESARQRAADLQTRFDVAQKDQELARLARDNELHAAAASARGAQLAQNAAELRAKDAELGRTRVQRLALIGGAFGAVLVSGSVILGLRSRRRADLRALAETEAARRAAEEAGALKTRLLGIASHDLKGPLRAMLRGAARLEREARDPEAVAGGARALRAQGERMFALIRDLLDLAAIENGALSLQRASLDLPALAAEIVSRHAARAVEKEQTLRCESAADATVTVVADAARVAQALENLVDNALKFTPPGGTVRVIVDARGDHACVSVSDDGPGLAAADLARLFQPFQTLSAVPTGGESSTGLGLHIAREIAALHGGRIEVDGAPGAGANFTLVLPLEAALVAAI